MKKAAGSLGVSTARFLSDVINSRTAPTVSDHAYRFDQKSFKQTQINSSKRKKIFDLE